MLLYDGWDERCYVSAKVCITLYQITASLLAHLKKEKLQDSNCAGN